MKIIYLDHAATTPTDPKVLKKMLPYFTDIYGNPSSIHHKGQEARATIDEARTTVADIFGCEETEILFTSGGTESDNLAIRGVVESFEKKGHIITTATEHHAVLHTVEDLKRRGYEITIVPVEKNGIVDPVKIEEAIKPETVLISVMYANNEIGTIQPLAKIGKIVEKRREAGQEIYFHTDAVQGIGTLEPRVDYLKCDLMSASSHKIYGPKGIGLLYVRKGTPLHPQQLGGGQEFKKRASTENTPGIVGFAEALKLVYGDKNGDEAMSFRDVENKKITKLRNYFIERILKEIPDSILNGDAENRLPGNINISIKKIEGESMLLRLNFERICASSGSACTSGTLDPSHVLMAIGLDHSTAHGSLRFTIGKHTTKKELEETINKLKFIVDDLRKISTMQ